MDWTVEFSRAAIKDARKLKSANLDSNVRDLISVIKINPYDPPYEKLSGNLKGYYSKRINIKHRLIYSIDEDKKLIRVISAWSHYE